MIKKLGRQPSQREKGQSLTELGISLIFLLILLAGTVDIGRALFSIITLNDAAQEGATYAAYAPGDTNGIVSRIQNYSDYPIDFSTFQLGSQILIQAPNGYCADRVGSVQNEIEVQVLYKMEIVTPFLGSILGSQEIPLKASSKVAILSPVCYHP